MRSTVIKAGSIAALAVISSAANAQSFAFTRTTFGVVDASRLATTSQAPLAIGDPVSAAPSLAVDASSLGDLRVDASSDVTWTVVLNSDADDDDKASIGTEGGFFSSAMGRASLVGMAGLAGASYYALRTTPGPVSLSTATGSTVDVRPPGAISLPGTPDAPGPLATPEPGTWALMLTGLVGLAGVARRRKQS